MIFEQNLFSWHLFRNKTSNLQNPFTRNIFSKTIKATCLFVELFTSCWRKQDTTIATIIQFNLVPGCRSNVFEAADRATLLHNQMTAVLLSDAGESETKTKYQASAQRDDFVTYSYE